MIVVLRGLPGSGKSTLAREIARHIEVVILDKDAVRAALFPGDTTEYRSTQDDLIVTLMMEAARWHLSRKPARPVFFDGRTHGRRYQVELVADFARQTATAFGVLECTCREETALRRIEADMEAGTHPAKNRNAALLRDQIAIWETIEYPACGIDTERPLEECVQEALAWLRSASAERDMMGA